METQSQSERTQLAPQMSGASLLGDVDASSVWLLEPYLSIVSGPLRGCELSPGLLWSKKKAKNCWF